MDWIQRGRYVHEQLSAAAQRSAGARARDARPARRALRGVLDQERDRGQGRRPRHPAGERRVQRSGAHPRGAEGGAGQARAVEPGQDGGAERRRRRAEHRPGRRRPRLGQRHHRRRRHRRPHRRRRVRHARGAVAAVPRQPRCGRRRPQLQLVRAERPRRYADLRRRPRQPRHRHHGRRQRRRRSGAAQAHRHGAGRALDRLPGPARRRRHRIHPARLRPVHARADAYRRQRARPGPASAGRQQFLGQQHLRRHRQRLLPRDRRELDRRRHLPGLRRRQRRLVRLPRTGRPVDGAQPGLARRRLRGRLDRQPRRPVRGAFAVGPERREQPGPAELSRSARLADAQAAGRRAGRGRDLLVRRRQRLRADDRHLDVDAAHQRPGGADAGGRRVPARRLRHARHDDHADRAADRLRLRRFAAARSRQRAQLRHRLGRDRRAGRGRGGRARLRTAGHRARRGHRRGRPAGAGREGGDLRRRERAHLPEHHRERRPLRAPPAGECVRLHDPRLRLRLPAVERVRRGRAARRHAGARRAARHRCHVQDQRPRHRRDHRLAAARQDRRQRLSGRAGVDRSGHRQLFDPPRRRQQLPLRRRQRHPRLRSAGARGRLDHRRRAGLRPVGRPGRLPGARLRLRDVASERGFRGQRQRAAERLDALEQRPGLAVRHAHGSGDRLLPGHRARPLRRGQRSARRRRGLGERRQRRLPGDAAAEPDRRARSGAHLSQLLLPGGLWAGARGGQHRRRRDLDRARRARRRELGPAVDARGGQPGRRGLAGHAHPLPLQRRHHARQ